LYASFKKYTGADICFLDFGGLLSRDWFAIFVGEALVCGRVSLCQVACGLFNHPHFVRSALYHCSTRSVKIGSWPT